MLYLVATAAAYPHHPFYNPYAYPVYPAQAFAPLPAPAPFVMQEAALPLARSVEELAPLVPLQDEKTARYLINFEAFQRISGAFKADSTTTPARTITGTASFYQNPFTGQTSKYKIALNGLTASQKYWVALTDDCTTPSTTLTKVNQ